MFDIIINDGQLADGESDSLRRADVAVEGDRIAAIGDLAQAEAKDRVDATGMVVCPGFVDIHNHAYTDVKKDIFDCDNLVRQGITSLVGSNCGTSHWPIAECLLGPRAPFLPNRTDPPGNVLTEHPSILYSEGLLLRRERRRHDRFGRFQGPQRRRKAGGAGPEEAASPAGIGGAQPACRGS